MTEHLWPSPPASSGGVSTYGWTHISLSSSSPLSPISVYTLQRVCCITMLLQIRCGVSLCVCRVVNSPLRVYREDMSRGSSRKLSESVAAWPRLVMIALPMLMRETIKPLWTNMNSCLHNMNPVTAFGDMTSFRHTSHSGGFGRWV